MAEQENKRGNNWGLNYLHELEQRCKEVVEKVVDKKIPFIANLRKLEMFWKVLYSTCLEYNCQPQDITKRELTDEAQQMIEAICRPVAKSIIDENADSKDQGEDIKKSAVGWMVFFIVTIYKELGLQPEDIVRVYGE